MNAASAIIRCESIGITTGNGTGMLLEISSVVEPSALQVPLSFKAVIRLRVESDSGLWRPSLNHVYRLLTEDEALSHCSHACADKNAGVGSLCRRRSHC